MTTQVYHVSLTEEQRKAWVFLQYTGLQMARALKEGDALNPPQHIKEGLSNDWWQFMRELEPAFEQALKATNH